MQVLVCCTAHILKWSSYLQLINSSTDASSQPCSEECGCHGPVINADLAVWKDRGGITYQDFLSSKESRFRGVHYKIINHALYRQPDCMFGPRWVWSQVGVVFS